MPAFQRFSVSLCYPRGMPSMLSFVLPFFSVELVVRQRLGQKPTTLLPLKIHSRGEKFLLVVLWSVTPVGGGFYDTAANWPRSAAKRVHGSRPPGGPSTMSVGSGP